MSLRPITPLSPAVRAGLHERRTRRLELEKRSGQAVVQLLVYAPGEIVETGDDQLQFGADTSLDGWELVDVAAFVTAPSSSGLVTVQLHKLPAAVDMLTTALTIDAGDTWSYDAATQAVINAANAELAQGDRIRLDVDTAGTNAEGLVVVITFEPA